VLQIARPLGTDGENRTTAPVLALKSPPRIDITPQHRDTRTREHQNHFLHA